MSFYADLRERGLADLPIAFGADGVASFMGDVSAADRAMVETLLASYDFTSGRAAKRLSAAQALAAAKARRLVEVDERAEAERLRWITPGTGQAMTYTRKVEEARRLQLDADPQPAAYPMLAASLGIDGGTLAAVAATILALDAQWGVVGAVIEARRLALKRAVQLSVDGAELGAIDVTSGWPEPAP